MGCRCADIARATRELGHCATGSTCVSSCQSSASNEGSGLPSCANSVFHGAYSVNRDAIATAIQELINPVHKCNSAAQTDFANATATITRLRAAWQIQDAAWHRAQAARRR